MTPAANGWRCALPVLADRLRDGVAGLVSAAVAATYGISYSALLFSGPLEPFLPYGVSVALISAALGAAVVCLTSSLPQAVGGPDSNTTSVLSVLLATLASELIAAGTTGKLVLAHAMLALFLATLTTAAVFYLLGWFRLGYLVRFVPYPVIGGFLAATGWLMTTGALGIVNGSPVNLGWLRGLLAHGPDLRLTAVVGLAVMFLVLLRRLTHPAALPVLLAGTIIVVYAGLAAGGISLAEARAQGWLFQEFTQPVFFPPWQLRDPAILPPQAIRWDLLVGHLGELIAILIIAAITVLLSAASLEVTTGQDIDLDRELRGHGIANTAIAFSGGYLGLLSIGRSLVIVKAGGTSRMAGVLVGVVCGSIILIGPVVVGILPKVVLAAFLFYLGLVLMHEWLIEALWTHRLSSVDYGLVLLILAVTVAYGFAAGMLAGGIAACVLFAVSAGSVPVVRLDTDGRTLRSGHERRPEHRVRLDRYGGAIRIMVLGGPLFYGVANSLLERIRQALAAAEPPQVLVLDFRGASGLDVSAAVALGKAHACAARAGTLMILAGVRSRHRTRLTAQGNRAKDYSLKIEAEASGGQGFALDPPGPGRSWTWRNLLKNQVLVPKGLRPLAGCGGGTPAYPVSPDCPA